MDYVDDSSKTEMLITIPSRNEFSFQEDLMYRLYNSSIIFPNYVQADSLVLYYKPGCPYCVTVLSYLENKGFDIELRNIEDPKYMMELMQIGGKRQVPCLAADDEYAMYESNDILSWLRTSECFLQRS